MHMQPMLALIIVLAIVGRIAIVMMATVSMMTVAMMMVVVAVVNVTILVVLVGVDQNARERAGRRCKDDAQCRRDGKHERRRPNEGDAASACFFWSRQHAFSLVPLQDRLSQRGVSKA